MLLVAMPLLLVAMHLLLVVEGITLGSSGYQAKHLHCQAVLLAAVALLVAPFFYWLVLVCTEGPTFIPFGFLTSKFNCSINLSFWITGRSSKVINLVDSHAQAARLDYVAGTYGGRRRPSRFLCLFLKLLQIQPEEAGLRPRLRRVGKARLTQGSPGHVFAVVSPWLMTLHS